jgi:Protein of unknown function (DUF3828)
MNRFLKLAPLLLALADIPAMAAPQSADAFLLGIYSHYLGDDKTAKGIFLDKPSDVHRYFADDLAALIIADDAAAAKRGDVPELDGDPFVDAQDWTITDIVVHIDSQTASAAKATVTFKNFKEPHAVHLDLVETPKGWRISDIAWKEGTFRGLYKKK